MLSGVVLAGGASRRMGTDKALLRLPPAHGAGEGAAPRLVDHAAAVLAACCDDVVVAAGDGRRIDGLAVPQIGDAVAGAGPLGGVLAGLRAARHPLVAVLAVDQPGADPAVFRLLAARWAGEAAVVPRAGGRLQPLAAVWARAAAGPLATLLARGDREVGDAVAGLGLRVVEEHDWRAAAPGADLARNLNRPDDLAAGH